MSAPTGWHADVLAYVHAFGWEREQFRRLVAELRPFARLASGVLFRDRRSAA